MPKADCKRQLRLTENHRLPQRLSKQAHDYVLKNLHNNCDRISSIKEIETLDLKTLISNFGNISDKQRMKTILLFFLILPQRKC